jgi:hypothetical protein
MLLTAYQNEDKNKWENKGNLVKLVSRESATHGIRGKNKAHDVHGLDLDHRNLVKFKEHSPQYHQNIKVQLGACVKNAVPDIKSRLERLRRSM